MADRSAIDSWNRRLALYTYLEPILTGRRVLEVGCGSGLGADYLARMAARVTAVEGDQQQLERARARYRRPTLDLRSVPDLGELSSLTETFDVVVIPDGDALVRRPGAVASWKKLLAEGGRLVVAVASSDRRVATRAYALHPPVSAAGPAGVGYYEVVDALASQFPRVRMFGQTPFVAVGMVEFDGAAEGLRVDSRLAEGGGEAPSHYVAIAGLDQELELGYALVQIPFSSMEARLQAADGGDYAAVESRALQAERRLEEMEKRGRARLDEAESRIADLRRKLDDKAIQAESAVRIARAQGEEIEELRGRLRRASEDRASLDGEIAKLRRALAEADESVMSLTRRTTEEMSAVAARLATGLRAPVEAEPARERSGTDAALREELEGLRLQLAEATARANAAERRIAEVGTQAHEREEEVKDLRFKIRRTEETLAREKDEVAALQARVREADQRALQLQASAEAVVERDERIAALEGEKQDLTWRLAEVEEKLRAAIAKAVAAQEPAKAQANEEVVALREARDRAAEEFRRAAAAHVEEVKRLQTAVAEQEGLVVELEDAVEAAEARAEAAIAEANAIRRNAQELEDADRARRSRLAELEGKLLRLERERAAAPSPAGNPEADELRRQLQAAIVDRESIRGELDRALARGAEVEGARSETEAARAERDAARAELESTRRELEAAREAARAQAEGAATTADLEAARKRGQELEEAHAAARSRIADLEAKLLRLENDRRVSDDEGRGRRELEIKLQGLTVERQVLTAQLERVNQLASEHEEAVWKAKDDLVAREARIGALEAELASLRAAATAAPANGHELGAGAVSGDLVTELASIEESLREQTLTLSMLEGTLQAEIEDIDHRSRREADARAHGDLADAGAEVILLHSTLANYRRRAARLRDEIESCRRRMESLSTSQLSVFLEELGEDLAELEK